jgi:formylglycine-generating enzyme required for sulfatase activity
MHGNVWEWVEDCYHENYKGAPENGSAWREPKSCAARVLRGGSWGGNAAYARSAARDYYDPVNRYDLIGFRVLCESHIVICSARYPL